MTISARNELFYPILAVASITLLVWQHLGMNRTFEIYPNLQHQVVVMNDQANGGRSIGTVKEEAGLLQLDCQILKSPFTFAFCGFLIPIASKRAGVDLTGFQTLDIWLALDSAVKDTALIYLQNRETDATGKTIERANLRTINPAVGMTRYQLRLDSFFAPSWWLFAHPNSADRKGDINLTQVTGVQVSTGDNTTERRETIKVQRIVLHGKWLSTAQLYLLLLIVWSGTIVAHIGRVTFRLRQNLLLSNSKAAALESINSFLSIEKNKYESMAKIDPLTKAYNRAGVRDTLDYCITQYEQSKSPCSIIMFDIDHFKLVNDRLGHDIGDGVLVGLVSLITSKIRKTDSLARWGGEEFVLVCQNTTLEIAIRLAEKYRAAIGGHPLFGQTITCSFGVSQLKSSDIASAFKEADAALYQAKAQGRNLVCYSGQTTAVGATSHTEGVNPTVS